MIALEARVESQQQTITVLQEQLAIAQSNNEVMLHRVLGNMGQAPAMLNGPQIVGQPNPSPRARAVSVPLGDLAMSGPGLPVPRAKGGDAPAPPTADELASTYFGEAGQDLFNDVGDAKADELGLSHDSVTGTVQQGKRLPSH